MIANPAEEAGKSLKSIVDAGKQGAAKEVGIAGKAMNIVTHGGVETVKQMIAFPFRTLIKPTARAVNTLAVSAVKNTVGFTWDLLKTVPFIPAPGAVRPDDASIDGRSPLASLHELSRSPLLRPGDPRRGPRTPSAGPDIESRPDVRPV